MPTPLAPPWPRRPEGRVLVMGILNVTPDSFSDGGFFAQSGAAIRHAEDMVQDGADILDVGGESTRPGALPISPQQEIARVVPVLMALQDRHFTTPISIDTYKAETAKAALAAGAVIVNDVWGLQHDPAMASVVAEAGAGLVIMHNRLIKDENIDIADDMERFFERSLALARKAGIPENRIALDPGIGFGKTLEHNLALLRALPVLRESGCAVLVGLSRKSMLGAITGRGTHDRLAASVAGALWCAGQGADIIRVHDVRETRDALRVWQALEMGAAGSRP